MSRKALAMATEGKTLVPCDQCPWRKSNQLKKHKYGFFSKANLTRLWRGIRTGNTMSCHKTDTGHPDHVACGAKGDQPVECAGAVIVALQECEYLAGSDGHVTPERQEQYKAKHGRRRFTMDAVMYWIFARIQMAGVPFVGGTPLPSVKVDDPAIGLPDFLKPESEMP